MGVATGVFQYANGSPVANGAYQWKLSQDCIVVGSSCVAPPIINGSLDASGNLTTTFAFNDILSTTGGATTFYQLTVKDQHGGQVWNENYYLTGTAANLNTIPPGGPPIIVTTPVAQITLETNGVANGSQVLLNLVNGANVALTNTSGNVTINATGGGGGGVVFSTAGQNGFWGPGIKLPNSGFPFAQTSAIAYPVANQIQVFQFSIDNTFVISRITVGLMSSVSITSGAVFAASIWDATNTTKLLDSGVFDVSGTVSGSPILPISRTIAAVTLTGGTYSYVETSNQSAGSAVGLMGQLLQGTLQKCFMGVINTNAVRFGFAASQSSVGVFPAALGAITAFPVTTVPSVTASCVLPLFEP